MSEDSPLLAPTVKARNAIKQIKDVGRGLIINRILIVVVLSLLCIFVIYNETQISSLTLQIETDKNNIIQLQALTYTQQQVISRFNSSITNNDVIKDLNILQNNISKIVQQLQNDLYNTKQDINQQLIQTKQELNNTINIAENEISKQVDYVKKDVEQYVITTQDQFSMENSFMVYQLAGTFTLLSCLISMWHMTAHLRKFNQPYIQRKILAILYMSPIYAITSWFSLVFHTAEGYLAIIKDAYEAYVIYQFLSFCIAVIGKGDRETVVNLLSQHANHLTPPFRLFGCFELCGLCKPEPYESNKQLADEILLQCQFFAMQFVFFRPLTTTLMVILRQIQYYGPFGATTAMDYRAPQFYITIIQNISIFVAFTGLLKFYHAVDQELKWCRPFAKFLCIKGVVFMTFWQGLAISVLAQTTDVGGEDADEWAKSAQNFLICLEMLLFSIAHFYCFPTEEWEDGYRVKHSQGNFGDSMALGDFLSDIKLIIKANNSKKKKKKKKKVGDDKLGQIPETDTIDDDDASSHCSNNTSPSSITKGSSTIEDDERLVRKALQESLGSVGDDPDIIEAQKRLLDSKVLSPEFFDYSDTEEIDNDDYYDIEEAINNEQDDWTDTKRRILDDHDNNNDNVDDKEDLHGMDHLKNGNNNNNDDDCDIEQQHKEQQLSFDDSWNDNSIPTTPRFRVTPSKQTNKATTIEESPTEEEEHHPPPPKETPPPPPQDDEEEIERKTSSSNNVKTDNNQYDDNRLVTERSRLLQQQHDDNGSTFIETLRPSIFTTVASMAQIERQASSGKINNNNNSGDKKKKKKKKEAEKV